MMVQLQYLCISVCIQPAVPQTWATVQISSPPDDSAIVGREFVMTCTVTAVRGLTVIPRVVWVGPDGDLTDVENITVGHPQTSGTETTRSLTLHFLQSHYGGWYSCIAAVNIPRLETPPRKPAHKHLAVISTLLLVCLHTNRKKLIVAYCLKVFTSNFSNYRFDQ